MKLQKIFISLAALAFASTVFAQTEKSMENRSTATRYSTATSQSGWFPSLGLNFGHLDQAGNSDNDGEGLSVQAIGSYYFPQTAWIGDAGIGFHKQYFSGLEEQPIVGMLSLGGRYQFANRISVGPVVDGFIGTSDAYGTANRYLTMIGVQAFKELAFTNDSLGRFGVKYSQEFGISDQNSDYLGLIFQYGIGSANSVVKNATAMNN